MMKLKGILFFICIYSFALMGQEQAYIFRETFENTFHWQIEANTESVINSKSQINLKNLGEATFIEADAMIIQHQNYVLSLQFLKVEIDFGIVFKNTEDKDYQIIKFTKEGIVRYDYDKKDKNYYQYRLGDYTSASSFQITRTEGVTTLLVNGKSFNLDLKSTNASSIGLWLEANKELTINKFEILWKNKAIDGINLFGNNEEIQKKELKTVNSNLHDVKPTVSEDGKTLYFTRKNELNTVYNDGAYHSKYSAGSWSSPEKLSSSFNDANHNVLSSIINKDSEAFILDQYASGKKIKDTYRVVSLKDDKLGSSTKIKIKDYQNTSSYISACMSEDGLIMILSLNNLESIGQNDLYVSFKKGKEWSKPENLGLNVNTKGNELAPFLSVDNSKLYFSSNGWPGYGTHDIFVVERKGSWTNWSTPKNLGDKINGSFWDAYFSITSDENLAMVCSNAGTTGGMNIYELRGQKRDLAEPLVYKGFVYDSLTMEPLTGATLTITDVRSFDNKVLFKLLTDSTGYFETELPKDIDFDVLIEKTYYNGAKDQIWYKDLSSNKVKRNYYLNKYKPGQEIALEQIYFVQGRDIVRDLSKPTLDKLYQILVDNPKIRIMIEGHTDNQGDKGKNQQLSEERTVRIKSMMVQLGIDEKRLETVGYGQEHPIAPNDTEFNMRLNRRVDFLIIE